MAGRVLPENGMVGADVKFDRIRRITGYLVGTTDRFNNAKRAEERDPNCNFTVEPQTFTTDLISRLRSL